MSSRGTILVVDDEDDILELVRYNLDRDGYSVVTVHTGEEALARARELLPAAIVLDLMLPEMDGLTVCKELKADTATAGVPILMLTAKSEDADVVAGLELGADDYLTKPFSPRVLSARLKAVLRRRGEARPKGATEQVRLGKLTLDPRRHQVWCGEHEVRLSATEFAILRFLASHPEWVYSRAQIIDAIHGTDYAVTERAVDVQVLGLRRKLGECGDCIRTVRGVGYRLDPGEAPE